jgi:hypothetical protein
MPQLESLLNRLIESSLEYVVVGGFAALAHGVTLLTQDIDICMPFSRENLLRLQDALNGLHPVHRITPQRLPFELTDRNIADFKNIYLDTDYGTLDCLGEIKGLGDYAAVLPLSEQLAIGGKTCRVLGIEGLILAKQATGRTHDRMTILQLRAIQARRRDTTQ